MVSVLVKNMLTTATEKKASLSRTKVGQVRGKDYCSLDIFVSMFILAETETQVLGRFWLALRIFSRIFCPQIFVVRSLGGNARMSGSRN